MIQAARVPRTGVIEGTCGPSRGWGGRKGRRGSMLPERMPHTDHLTSRSPTSMARLRDIWVPIMEHPWNGPCSGGFITCGDPRIQAPSIFLSHCPLGPRLESGEVHLLWGTWTGTEKRLAPHCGSAMGCPPLSGALSVPASRGPRSLTVSLTPLQPTLSPFHPPSSPLLLFKRAPGDPRERGRGQEGTEVVTGRAVLVHSLRLRG